MECEHKFVYFDTSKRDEYLYSIGQHIYKRIDYFFCEKCLEKREIKKSEQGYKKPEWY